MRNIDLDLHARRRWNENKREISKEGETIKSMPQTGSRSI